MTLALFDIDGTLVAGPSTEKRLFLALLKRGFLGPRQLFAFGAFAAVHAARFGAHTFKKDKAYLTGLHEREMTAFAQDWVARESSTWWFEPCVARLRRHQAQGDTVVLLSGTPDFVARAIGDALRVHHVYGSHCQSREGRYLPAPPLVHPFADEKVELARTICARFGANASDVVAYADSAHDLAVLRFAGTPIAVRPDQRLRAAAHEAHWEILGAR